jgi:pimeloyl-ACP methyl ester carboxylesterase
MPVHAFGYNWLADNDAAAIKLAGRIEEIRHQYGSQCRQVILVTHSMGGLVARRCAQLPGMSDAIAGVMHGVMPTNGAPVAYRRCKVGMQQESEMAAAVIGVTGQDVTAVFAQSPGALQLLPTKNYSLGWLRLRDPDHAPAMPALPEADPYQEIYLRRDRWWALLREEWLKPKDGVPIEWVHYARNIKKAKQFHERIGAAYHPYTYVYYGADAKQPSFETITWQMRPGRGDLNRPLGVPPEAFVVSTMQMEQVRDQGSSPLYVGGSRVVEHLPARAGRLALSMEVSHWELHCEMQDGIGDGTVPVSSGQAPAAQAREGQVRVQVCATGFDHEGAFKVMQTRHFTLYSLIKIAAQAKRPSCVA